MPDRLRMMPRIIPLARYLASLVVLAGAYMLAAGLSVLLAVPGAPPGALWLCFGLAIAALSRGGLVLWPAVLAGALGVHAMRFGMHFSGFAQMAGALTIALGKTLEAVVAAWALRRAGPHVLDSLWGVFKFLGIVLGASAVGALSGAAGLQLGAWVPAAAVPAMAWTRWLGDVASALLIVPLVLAWFDARPVAGTAASQDSGLLLATAFAALCVAIFVLPEPSAMGRLAVFLVFPVIAIGAYAYGGRGAGLAVATVAACAVGGAMRGCGPFMGGSPTDVAARVDSCIAFCAVIGMTLTADRIERAQADVARSVTRDITPWLALLGSVALTVGGWALVAHSTEQEGAARFAQLGDQVRWRLQTRMQEYERVLRGGVALFAAAPRIDRAGWHEFVAAQQIQERLPGVQGVGFVARVTAADRERFVQSVRGEGFAGFHVFPAGERPEYMSVLFIEPFDARNRRAFGYDVFSEPVRRTALIDARDTGAGVLTGRLRLVQEDDQRPQEGFLLYLPVYAKGTAPQTVAQRQAALRGFVFSPFRIGDLVTGILQSDWPQLRVQVFDGSDAGPEDLLYADPQFVAGPPGPTAPRTQDLAAPLLGHPMTLRIQATPAFEATVDRRKAQFVFLAGIVVSLLMFGAVRAQTLMGERAVVLARRMTRDAGAAHARAREITERLAAIVASSGEAIISQSLDGRIETWNKGAEALFGYLADEIVGRTMASLLPADKIDEERRLAARVAAGETIVQYQTTQVHRDGSVLDVAVTLSPIRSAEGTLEGISKVVRDITPQRLLREMQERQAAILQSAGVSIITTDTRGIIQSFNAEAERMLGFAAAEVIGTSLPAMFHMPAEVQERALQLSAQLGHYVPANFEALFAWARRGAVDQREWTYLRRDGSAVPVSVSVSATRDADAQINGFISIAIDISARKAHESLQRTALLEKETLLKEVYHRVKNNLQVVSSLFNLQLRGLPPGLARTTLQQSADRVRAMALVHEKLCRSNNLETIDILAYVGELCESLSAATGARERGIALELDIDPLEIGLDASVPLGLLLNELICNSLKHAFPDGRRGTVHVRLACDVPGVAVLEVRDDGIGMAADVLEGRTASLGLRLTRTLARQLGGKLALLPGPGTTVVLSFPVGAAMPTARLERTGIEQRSPARSTAALTA